MEVSGRPAARCLLRLALLKMPLETVHFDSVSGVTPSSKNRRRVTLFNFTAGEHSEYSVPAPGTPQLLAGMAITAFLEEESNWQTLVGWRDHANGAIVCDSAAEETFLCFALPPIILFLVSTAWRQPANLLAVVVLTAYLVWAIRRVRMLRPARTVLTALPLPKAFV